MEFGPLEVQRLALLANPLLPSNQRLAPWPSSPTCHPTSTIPNTYLGNDSVELGPLEVQRLALLADPLLPSNQRLEILYRLGHYTTVQPDHHLAHQLAPNLELHEHL